MLYGQTGSAQRKAPIYYTQSADTGLTWSSPIAITDINRNAWNPAIAVNGPNIHVVWREIDTLNGHRSSWYKHSLDGGNTWSTHQQLTFATGRSEDEAITAQGSHIHMSWNDNRSGPMKFSTNIQPIME